jgi:hypothetical protein
MRKALNFTALIFTSFTCLSASAEDFKPLMAAVRSTWPGQNRIGIVCDYTNNKEQIDQLAKLAGSNASIGVVDCKNSQHAAVAALTLIRYQPKFMVLLPRDAVYGEGRFNATAVVRYLAIYGIPSVGTGPEAIKQGAIFAVGEPTKGELLVNSKLNGSISVIMPTKADLVREMSLAASLREEPQVTVLGLP